MVPSAFGSVVVDAYHMPVFLFGGRVVVEMRHHKGENHPVAVALFPHPPQSRRVHPFGTLWTHSSEADVISVFVPRKEIHSEELHSHFSKVIHISAHPFFGSRAVQLSPEVVVITAVFLVSVYEVFNRDVSAFYFYSCRGCTGGHPKRIAIYTESHSTFSEIVRPPSVVVLPTERMPVKIAILVVSVGLVHPTVGGNHCVAVAKEVIVYPVDVLFPLVFRNGSILHKVVLIRTPI